MLLSLVKLIVIGLFVWAYLIPFEMLLSMILSISTSLIVIDIFSSIVGTISFEFTLDMVVKNLTLLLSKSDSDILDGLYSIVSYEEGQNIFTYKFKI